MTETTVVAPATDSTPKEGRPDAVVVSQDNFKEYVDEKLGVGEHAAVAEDDPEAAAAAEHAELERKQAEADAAAKTAENAPKEGELDGPNVYHKGQWVKKNSFEYRVFQATEKAKAEAEAKITAAAAEAKEARDAKEAAEKAAADLKAKYEPAPDLSVDIGPEPQPEQFPGDPKAYGAALKDWAAKDTLQKEAQKQAETAAAKAQETAAATWKQRVAETVKEMPDFEAKISGSSVTLSDQARDAIFESDAGPKILYHFADHPDEAVALGKLTVKAMLKEIGRLEATLGSAAKPPVKSDPVQTTAKVVEISKAPPPISPLKGGNAIGASKINEKGEWIGTYEEFKAADRAGKFK